MFYGGCRGMPTVLLIRHGESQSNAGLPTQSDSVDLTLRGFTQAYEVSRYLIQNSLIPDLIVTSPYRRTQETAFPLKYLLLEKCSLKPLEEEWPVQEFTYLSSWKNECSTVQDRQPVVNLFWEIADPSWVDGPGTESFEQFIDRVRDFKACLESTQLGTIAVFSHEQFISAFLWLFGKGEVTPTSEEMSEFRKYLLTHPIPNGAIVQAKFRKGYGWIQEPSLTEHLSMVELRAPLSAKQSSNSSQSLPLDEYDTKLLAQYRRNQHATTQVLLSWIRGFGEELRAWRSSRGTKNLRKRSRAALRR